MWRGVVLLPDEAAVAEEAFDSWKEVIFEDVDISGSGNVADDDERSDDTVPADTAVDMERRRVSVDVCVFDITDF